MPFTYSEHDGVLRVLLSGRLSSEELHGLMTEVEALAERGSRWPDRLIDIRRMEVSGVTFPDVMSLTRRREGVTPPAPIRTAIVADTALMIGLARMFQSLSNNPSITVELFTTVEAAERWLADARA